jgi:SH3-like domain-containing protein
MSRTMSHILCAARLALAVLVVWTVAPESAFAEAVKTTRKTRVMAQPGERSPVVKRVPAGREMKVLAREGRWIKVRVGSQTGWVTRTSVRSTTEETRAARTSARKIRRRAFVDGRSKRRGWSAGPPADRLGEDSVGGQSAARKARKTRAAPSSGSDRDDSWGDTEVDEEVLGDPGGGAEFADRSDQDEFSEQVTAPKKSREQLLVSASEAEAFSRPSARSKSQFFLEEGDKLFLVSRSRSGRWLEVENSDGDVGWVRASSVAVQSRSEGYRYAPRTVITSAGLGVTSFGTTFSSNGQGQLASYRLTSMAGSVSASARALFARGSQTRLLGADVRYTGSRASPGIRYADEQGNVGDTAFSMHEVDAGAMYGYRFEDSDKGLAGFVRAGYFLNQFQIDNVQDLAKDNLAHLPSERLTGITVGVGGLAPRLTEKLGAAASVALLLNGSRAQTSNLEDGLTSKANALWGNLDLIYQWKPNWQLSAAYRLFKSDTTWEGAAPSSQRGHEATEAERSDVLHTVVAGLSRAF